METKDTIESIIRQSSAQTSQDLLIEEGLPAILVPKDHDLVNIENLSPAPARKRAFFSTPLLASFRSYCENELSRKNAGGRGVCFVDGEKLQAIAILDAGTIDSPEHAENKAVYELRLNEEYEAVLAIHGTDKQQLDMCHWLEDWSDYLGEFYDTEGEPIEYKKAINALRKIKFTVEAENTHEESDFSSQQTGLARIAAQSGSEANLPARVDFRLHAANELPETRIEARILVKNAKGGPLIKLQIINIQKLKQTISEQFLHAVAEQVDDLDLHSYVGSGRIN